MIQAPPRLCPRCGEEYLATVSTCADCGVSLLSGGEPAGAQARGLQPGEAAERIRVENPAWIEVLAARLADEGIPSRVELVAVEAPAPRRAGAPCALFVRSEDAQRARAIDAALLRSQLPDLPEEASAEWRETEACPACGTPVVPDAAECEDCGLAFGDPEAG